MTGAPSPGGALRSARWLSDAAALELREGLLAEAGEPQAAARYEIREEIARGGMGIVYRARDRELQRDVALKALRIPGTKLPDSPEREGGGVPEGPSRLLAEALVLARLEHPGLVPVHDVGTLPDGRVFYTMKLVRGCRLDDYLRNGSAPGRSELLRVFARICEAVAFAHAHGVVHRDLKPENIMVGPFGEVLVMDWGIAKLLPAVWPHLGPEPRPALPQDGSPAPAPPATAQGSVLGTPGYMAPEQARGEIDRIDRRADVYSLGALLCFLLTGSPLPPRPRPQAAAGEALPRPLAAICGRAMAEDPEQRYACAEDLASDLASYAAGLPVSAHRESVLERAGRFARRHRTAILLILGYLVMRVLLLVFGHR